MIGTLFDLTPPGSSAEISPCGLYRYTLARRWDDRLAVVNFVMLNPSTADASEDDPTIRRCIGFARAWGQGGLVVTNLFAYRATDPDSLASVLDPIGPENNAHIGREARAANFVVRAWGGHSLARQRGRDVTEALRAVGIATYHLKLTRSGQPAHPLYLKGDLEPVKDRS